MAFPEEASSSSLIARLFLFFSFLSFGCCCCCLLLPLCIASAYTAGIYFLCLYNWPGIIRLKLSYNFSRVPKERKKKTKRMNFPLLLLLFWGYFIILPLLTGLKAASEGICIFQKKKKPIETTARLKNDKWGFLHTGLRHTKRVVKSFSSFILFYFFTNLY